MTLRQQEMKSIVGRPVTDWKPPCPWDGMRWDDEGKAGGCERFEGNDGS